MQTVSTSITSLAPAGLGAPDLSAMLAAATHDQAGQFATLLQQQHETGSGVVELAATTPKASVELAIELPRMPVGAAAGNILPESGNPVTESAVSVELPQPNIADAVPAVSWTQLITTTEFALPIQTSQPTGPNPADAMQPGPSVGSPKNSSPLLVVAALPAGITARIVQTVGETAQTISAFPAAASPMSADVNAAQAVPLTNRGLAIPPTPADADSASAIAPGQITVSLTVPAQVPTPATGTPGPTPLPGDAAITPIPAGVAADKQSALQASLAFAITKSDTAATTDSDTAERATDEGAPQRRPAGENAAVSERASAWDRSAIASPTASASPERTAGPTPVPPAPIHARALPDRAEAVATVVDRLMAARQAGLDSVSTVAIGHREFGEVKVTFADRGASLEVSVAAANQDDHRALAAAIHAADRPAPRDSAQPAASSPSPAFAAASQDRGADGQPSHQASHRQGRDETHAETSRQTQPSEPRAEAPATPPARGGIYV